MNTQTLRTLGTMLLVAVAFASGVLIGGKGVFADQLTRYGLPAFAAGAISSDQPTNTDFSPVWKAWNILDERFVDTHASTTASTTEEVLTPEERKQERVWGMIQGLAASLGDPYTVFLPPSEAEIFNDDISGSFEGVGMEISIRDGVLTIVSPLKGTPASLAGLKSADRILEIDGESTVKMGIDGAVRRIRGPRGSDVVFTILREGEREPLEISVTRDTINIPTIETRKRADGIFVIELLNFSAKSPDLFRLALKEFVDSNSRKLIIDLRGNPGGFLDAAVDMASWFLPSGKIVVTEDYGGNETNKVHRSRGYDVFNPESMEVVILIDRGSASASEILAGALHEHGIATLVGTRSFGKGSVQELINITKDTSLKVTVARWLLAGDVFITQDGIEPDILVEIPSEDEGFNPERDYILDKAVEHLNNR